MTNATEARTPQTHFVSKMATEAGRRRSSAARSHSSGRGSSGGGSRGERGGGGGGVWVFYTVQVSRHTHTHILHRNTCPARVFDNGECTPLQGQTGESVSRPNAFRVRGVRTASQLTLQAVQAAFPLAGLGTFHFRWKVRPQELGNGGRQTPASASGGAPPRSSFKSCYLDVTNPSDSIPLFDGKAIAKVLLLGTIPNAHAAKRATRHHQLTLSIGSCTCYGGA